MNATRIPAVPEMLDLRLQRRYEVLVLNHLAPLHSTAAGLRSLPDAADSFAATQAAWRFFRNRATRLVDLAQPLLQAAHSGIRSACQSFVLVVHDWSNLHLNTHTRKHDRVSLANHQDHGYELQTALAVSDFDGAPIALVCQSLKCADGIHSTRFAHVRQPPPKLDRLAPLMRWVDDQHFAKPAVHMIDREADSVCHFRAWSKHGRLFLVRADDRRVTWAGNSQLLTEVVAALGKQPGGFRRCRDVRYHGKAAHQWVAETTVILDQPSKHDQGRVTKKGPALRLRLVVAQVRNATGAVLAEWMLLSNVTPAVSAATLALWYYWRWDIESYFKLLKSAGLQVEEWQQETGLAVAKRLAVAAMACVMVWKVGRSVHPQANELRELLIRLSGRQMKTGVEWTDPAGLAGLYVLLQALAIAEHYDLNELREMLRQVGTNPEEAFKPPGYPPKDDV